MTNWKPIEEVSHEWYLNNKYNQPKEHAIEGYIDEGKYLKNDLRHITNWFLSPPKKPLSARKPLPKGYSSFRNTSLYGELESITKKDTDKVKVEISKLKNWSFDKHRSDRGLWICSKEETGTKEMKDVYYKLKAPCTKKIRTKNGIQMSQEMLHREYRSKIGLLSNIIDMLCDSKGILEHERVKHFSDLTPLDAYKELCLNNDERKSYPNLPQQPFDYALLKMSADFVKRELKYFDHNFTINGAFMQGLLTLENEFCAAKRSGYDWADPDKYDHEQSAIVAERRSNRKPWGDLLDNDNLNNKYNMLISLKLSILDSSSSAQYDSSKRIVTLDSLSPDSDSSGDGYSSDDHPLIQYKKNSQKKRTNEDSCKEILKWDSCEKTLKRNSFNNRSQEHDSLRKSREDPSDHRKALPQTTSRKKIEKHLSNFKQLSCLATKSKQSTSNLGQEVPEVIDIMSSSNDTSSQTMPTFFQSERMIDDKDAYPCKRKRSMAKQKPKMKEKLRFAKRDLLGEALNTPTKLIQNQIKPDYELKRQERQKRRIRKTEMLNKEDENKKRQEENEKTIKNLQHKLEKLEETLSRTLRSDSIPKKKKGNVEAKQFKDIDPHCVNRSSEASPNCCQDNFENNFTDSFQSQSISPSFRGYGRGRGRGRISNLPAWMTSTTGPSRHSAAAPCNDTSSYNFNIDPLSSCNAWRRDANVSLIWESTQANKKQSNMSTGTIEEKNNIASSLGRSERNEKDRNMSSGNSTSQAWNKTSSARSQVNDKVKKRKMNWGNPTSNAWSNTSSSSSQLNDNVKKRKMSWGNHTSQAWNKAPSSNSQVNDNEKERKMSWGNPTSQAWKKTSSSSSQVNDNEKDHNMSSGNPTSQAWSKTSSSSSQMNNNVEERKMSWGTSRAWSKTPSSISQMNDNEKERKMNWGNPTLQAWSKTSSSSSQVNDNEKERKMSWGNATSQSWSKTSSSSSQVNDNVKERKMNWGNPTSQAWKKTSSSSSQMNDNEKERKMSCRNATSQASSKASSSSSQVNDNVEERKMNWGNPTSQAWSKTPSSSSQVNDTEKELTSSLWGGAEENTKLDIAWSEKSVKETAEISSSCGDNVAGSNAIIELKECETIALSESDDAMSVITQDEDCRMW